MRRSEGVSRRRRRVLVCEHRHQTAKHCLEVRVSNISKRVEISRAPLLIFILEPFDYELSDGQRRECDDYEAVIGEL